MDRPDESAPLVEGAGAARQQYFGQPLPAAAVVDPDNPPWGWVAGLLTWLGSVALLVAMPLLFIFPYIALRFTGTTRQDLEQFLSTDKTAVLLQILSTFPAHLLTLGIVWAVVTRFGKRPFWRALGMDWGERLGPWSTIGLAVGLLIFGIALTQIIRGNPTQIDFIISSSDAARWTLALLAATTAPLVEELVYRGVLYSALRKTTGMVWAVIVVSVLFTAVHVLQYYNNLGVVVVISILSLSLTLVRAFSGRLLPCIVIHFIFNGLQSIYIAFQPYFERSGGEQQAGLVSIFARAVRQGLS